MTNPWIVLIVTVGIIILSAFFVIMEFSLMGARRYRLEAKAETSRSARAALKGVNELTIMLAGAQLGITACTFALGAITKPAVDAWLSPLLEATGMPAWLSDSGSFLLSLLIVTFLHLVIGEMAPKSIAIAYPEQTAMATALPARGFVWVLGPLLRWINSIANRLVSASGVKPVDRAAVGGQDAATIRQLVAHSAAVGTLQADVGRPVWGALDLESLEVDELIADDQVLAEVAATDTVADLQAAAMESRHLRILVRDDRDALGVVHVRDTLNEPTDRVVGDLAREALSIPAGTLVHEALRTMQQANEQLAVVVGDTGALGVITFHDAIRRLLPRHDADTPGEPGTGGSTAANLD